MNSKKTGRIYDILRHANAIKIPGAPWEIDTKFRPLSAVGIAQAMQLRDNLHRTSEEIVLAVHSPAPRASHTMLIGLNGRKTPVMELPQLFTPDGGDGTLLNKAFQTHGLKLREYLKDTELFSILNRFGTNAAGAIKTAEESCFGTDRPKGTVLVATHGVIANFIALHLAEHCDNDSKELCYNTELGEAERLRVNVDECRIELVRLG